SGNPWVQFILERHATATLEHRGKVIILYTHQQGIPGDSFFAAIKAAPRDWEWWLRMHPARQHEVAHFRQQAQKFGILDRINLVDAQTDPLPLILLHSSLHISGYSGAIAEAALLGIPSVIIDSIG